MVELKLWSNYNYSYIVEGTHRLPCKRNPNQTTSQRRRKKTDDDDRNDDYDEERRKFLCRADVYMSIFISSSRHLVRTFFYSTFFHVFVLCTCVAISFNTISIVSPPMHYDCENTKYVFSSLCLSRAHKHAYN